MFKNNHWFSKIYLVYTKHQVGYPVKLRESLALFTFFSVKICPLNYIETMQQPKDANAVGMELAPPFLSLLALLALAGDTQAVGDSGFAGEESGDQVVYVVESPGLQDLVEHA